MDSNFKIKTEKMRRVLDRIVLKIFCNKIQDTGDSNKLGFEIMFSWQCENYMYKI